MLYFILFVKNMKKVWINPGCITCGRCEFITPEIFEVLDIARVKSDGDIEKHKELILQAARSCPVQVIKFIDKEKTGES